MFSPYGLQMANGESQEVHGSIRFVSVCAKGVSERFGSKAVGFGTVHVS